MKGAGKDNADDEIRIDIDNLEHIEKTVHFQDEEEKWRATQLLKAVVAPCPRPHRREKEYRKFGMDEEEREEYYPKLK